jgi:hypothetical protein
MTQLLAPNGKPSNLTPEQWRLVRNPQFKAWFGDWENDPENASKVVDENGEPLVVYHGTKESFNEFKKESQNAATGFGDFGAGFYFTSSYDTAKYYTLKFEKRVIFSVFLKILNPFFIELNWERFSENTIENYKKLKGLFDWQKLAIKNVLSDKDDYRPSKTITKEIGDYNFQDILSVNGFDGVFVNRYNIYEFEDANHRNQILPLNEIVAFEPNQIKLADGTNTTFDGSNTDIRFAEGGMISNVQQGDALTYKDSEFLDFDSVIYVEGVTENASGTLVSLSNGQRMFLPQIAEKFRIATPSEMNRSEIMGKELFSKGGNTKRNMKKIKRGGITYGKSHAEGGIPVKNQSTGDMLEVEGGEGIVNKRSMASKSKVTLNGKKMNICQAVSELNQMEGGVKFSCEDVNDRQFIKAMAKGGELERGVRTEQEHIQVLKDLYAKRITPKQASERIAKDHLKEDSRYYSKLAKIEGKMADGGKTRKNAKKTLSEAVGFDINSIDISKL